MRTYDLIKRPGQPLYESLYLAIREDIRAGRLAPGDKLPSKRALAANLEVGKTTVEAAYAQLLEEGYIASAQRRGFFVEAVEIPEPTPAPLPPCREVEKGTAPLADLTGNGTGQFPFSVWARLQREVILDYGKALLAPMDPRGAPALRQAIARNLSDFRGLRVDPENILVGAGTDFLYNLLMQLLGQDKVYGVEDPGYGKIRKIYAAGGVRCRPIPMDDQGLRIGDIGTAQVLHISPGHHFPTGLITPQKRRREMLDWAKKTGGFIIEDDYDTEFRFRGHPIPPMQTLDPERVIYMNTFSKTLSPSIRISYMVLPPALMDRFRRELGFYGCTVASFEQYTLARFLDWGYFEKHINRMRLFYMRKRREVMDIIKHSGLISRCEIIENDSGLHFLLRLETTIPDEIIEKKLLERGIRIESLSDYDLLKKNDRMKAKDKLRKNELPHRFIINYSNLKIDAIEGALKVLQEICQDL